jgi:hypothetical protein
MLLTPCGVDIVNTLLYHMEVFQLAFFPPFLLSFSTLSEGYNTQKTTSEGQDRQKISYKVTRSLVIRMA